MAFPLLQQHEVTLNANERVGLIATDVAQSLPVSLSIWDVFAGAWRAIFFLYSNRRYATLAPGRVFLVLLALIATSLGAQPSPSESDAVSDAVVEAEPIGVDAPDEPIEALATEDETAVQPEVIEDVVDQVLRAADLSASGNTPVHFAVAAGFLLITVLLRRLLVRWLFLLLKRLAKRTQFEFDDYVLPAVEGSVRSLILVLGIAGALMVLKLPPAVETILNWAYVLAVSIVLLVFFLRFTDAFLDHLRIRASKRELNIVSFMPWIRRIVLTIVFIFGVLTIARALGGDVRSFLAGLGIGGLAVALAAQDTLANIFGSVVVAVDQPFRLGEFVRIGEYSGNVEDIGLRSTRLRTVQGNLVTIPNKTVAAEAIVNLTRFIRRRVEQTFNLTYDATPEQMADLVEDIRSIVLDEEEVDKSSVVVQFTELGPSSLDIWLIYNTIDPDFAKHLKLKQRINIAIIKAVAARGMEFAYPTRSLHFQNWPSDGSNASVPAN